MPEHAAETHWEDPAYQQILQLLQRGEWQKGLEDLKDLGDKYPLSQELRSLRAEMTLRSRVDTDEQADIIAARQRRLKTWGIRMASVVAFLILALVAYSTYATRIQQQVQSARANIEQELHAVQLAGDMRNAQDLLQAGRAGDARLLLQNIAAKVPDYPGLDQAMQQANTMATLEDKYNQAMQQIQANDPAGALATLEKISAKEPYYRDVSIQITDLKREIFLSDMLAQADQAFNTKDWAKAVSGYETIHALDPLYQTQEIEDRLYQGYINAAEAALAHALRRHAARPASRSFANAIAESCAGHRPSNPARSAASVPVAGSRGQIEGAELRNPRVAVGCGIVGDPVVRPKASCLHLSQRTFDGPLSHAAGVEIARANHGNLPHGRGPGSLCRSEMLARLWRGRRPGKLDPRPGGFGSFKVYGLRRLLNLFAPQPRQDGRCGNGRRLDGPLQQSRGLFHGRRRSRRVEVENLFFGRFDQWVGRQAHQRPEHNADGSSLKDRAESQHQPSSFAVFRRWTQQAKLRPLGHTSSLFLIAAGNI